MSTIFVYPLNFYKRLHYCFQLTIFCNNIIKRGVDIVRSFMKDSVHQPQILSPGKPISDIKFELHPHNLVLKKIKSLFDTEYKLEQSTRIKFLNNIFYTSNDNVTYWDIPLNQRSLHKACVQNALEKNKKLNPINLFVADCDYISWSMENIPGDILIMDIDTTLLDFIEEQNKFLINLYQLYRLKLILFSEVKKEIKNFLRDEKENLPSNLNNRKKILGSHHWFYSEENYKKSMENLIKRNIVTLNIDLFNETETNTLIALLKKNNCIVPFVNLTNLPDYDEENKLSLFLKNLPVAKNKDARLFLSNIHDRGLNSRSIYDHYFHYATDSKAYDQFYQQKMPKFLAINDFYYLLNDKNVLKNCMNKEGGIIEHGFSLIINKYEKQCQYKIHNIKHLIFREKYFKVLDEYEKKFYAYCQQPDNKKRNIFTLANEFSNQLKPLCDKQSFFHIDKVHGQFICHISTFCESHAINLTPHMFDLLKTDKLLAKSIANLLSQKSRDDKLNKIVEIENAYIGNILELLHSKNDSRKKSFENFLTASKGPKCVSKIDQLLKEDKSTLTKSSNNHEKMLCEKLKIIIGPFVEESKPIAIKSVPSEIVRNNGFFSRVKNTILSTLHCEAPVQSSPLPRPRKSMQ